MESFMNNRICMTLKPPKTFPQNTYYLERGKSDLTAEKGDRQRLDLKVKVKPFRDGTREVVRHLLGCAPCTTLCHSQGCTAGSGPRKQPMSPVEGRLQGKRAAVCKPGNVGKSRRKRNPPCLQKHETHAPPQSFWSPPFSRKGRFRDNW